MERPAGDRAGASTEACCIYSVGFHRAVARRIRGELRGAARPRSRCGARLHANPIAVDATEFDALAAADGVQARRAGPDERPEILVLRVDRADSPRTPRGFRVGRLLERVPYRGRIGLLALLDLSREEIP
jgi:hypothetical protein